MSRTSFARCLLSCCVLGAMFPLLPPTAQAQPDATSADARLRALQGADRPREHRESIRKALESVLARRGRMTLETRAVVESQQGLAVLHGAWVIEPQAAMGAEIATRGLSTEVVRKQPDGTWLFVIDNPYTPE